MDVVNLKYCMCFSILDNLPLAVRPLRTCPVAWTWPRGGSRPRFSTAATWTTRPTPTTAGARSRCGTSTTNSATRSTARYLTWVVVVSSDSSFTSLFAPSSRCICLLGWCWTFIPSLFVCLMYKKLLLQETKWSLPFPFKFCWKFFKMATN